MEYSDNDVHAWIDTIASPTRRRDALTLLEIMKRVSGEEPRMWGSSIIGFGHYHYRYASGVEGDAGAAGFSPRKAAMTVYFPDGTATYARQLERLGPHKTGVVCLYLTDFRKIDLDLLESMITDSYRAMTANRVYGHLAEEFRGGRSGI
ncbi:DUF1801 domain-containing protein [Cryobacterium glaciale]|uniref:DUF1801 domain-containing protein n=1 Tax=Cryobacterium glaciale TaxID=1259145 RepID=UPI001F544914|nr:DUF1801 domain-containing protein [Cryobacterium glaciale]